MFEECALYTYRHTNIHTVYINSLQRELRQKTVLYTDVHLPAL